MANDIGYQPTSRALMDHFELTGLPAELSACANVHLDAAEHGRELIFLHQVNDGPANQSYGLHVAELAGVPRDEASRAAPCQAS